LKIKSSKKLFKYAIFLLIIAGVVSAGYFGYNRFIVSKASSLDVKESTVKVKRGDLVVSLTGTGVIEPINTYNIVPLVSGDIISAPFDEGMEVKKGDLLYEIDDEELDIQIQRTENSIKKAKLSNKSNSDSIEELIITAPFDGKIIDFSTKEGDSINNSSTIATIVDDSKLTVKVPFNVSAINNIEVGQKVQLVISDYMTYIDGKVKSKNNTGIAQSDGSIYCYAEIEIANPGAIVTGTEVSAIVETSKGNIQSITTGTIEYAKEQVIIAETGGNVKQVYIENNDRVKAGQKIIELENDSLLTNEEINNLQLIDLELNLESLRKERKDYKIMSPIDGKVIKKNYKAGETINNANSSTVLMTVADMSKMVFTMQIDELDIAKVKLGQSVEIEADAFPGEIFEGAITTIAAEGVASNGVTTFDVEVTISNPGNLKPGMNVNGEILIKNKENVLYLPMSAVQKVQNKVFVFVKGNNSDEGNKEKKRREVKVGINNDEYIEIVEGLEEGEIIILPYSQAKSSSRNSERQGNFGMPGMGGPPRN